MHGFMNVKKKRLQVVSIQARLLSGYPRACDSFFGMGNSFSLLQSVQTLCGAQSTSFSVDPGGGASFLEIKRPGREADTLISIHCRG